MFMLATASLLRAVLPSSLLRAMAIQFFRTVESSMTVRSLRFPTSLRIIIKRCIFVGRNIAKRAIMRSKHQLERIILSKDMKESVARAINDYEKGKCFSEADFKERFAKWL